MTDEKKGSAQPSDVVIDRGQSRLSDFWKLEDYWAIWLGFFLLIAGMVIYFPNRPDDLDGKIAAANSTMEAEAVRAPFKTIEWYEASDSKKKNKAVSSPAGKRVQSFTHKPHKWKNNPLKAFYLSEESADVLRTGAAPKHDETVKAEKAAFKRATESQASAAGAGFQDEELNGAAAAAIAEWRSADLAASKAGKKAGAEPYSQVLPLLALMILLALLFGIGWKLMGNPAGPFIVGFFFVFVIAVLAYTAASQATMKQFGIGYAAWAILFGLIISNTIGTPRWVMPAVQTEYYIKTGLVLLGAEILFGKILTIGVPGIFVAWVVTPIVLVSTYLFGQKVIKIPSKTLNITISADMSVCGVSAAIATAAACRAKKEELTLAVGLSLVFTSVMMIVMPAVIKLVGISEVLGGAWMGGTIDATGAVAAAGAFLGEKALYVAATIKMIQNVLIGVIAFCVAVYWCAKVDRLPGQKVSALEIWYRFPKFVIGFILASIIFSSMYGAMGQDVGYAMIDNGVIRGFSKIFRGWFFCLAFASIGLATNFRELKHHFKGGKPLILYVCGQSFNLCLTLTMAYIMFYLVFPEITAKI